MNIFEELLNNFENQKLLEYTTGGRRLGAKYIQRFGVPGKYQYVYPIKKWERLSRKTKFHFARFVKHTARFMKMISFSYEQKGINIKPLNWHNALVDINKKDGDLLQLGISLKSHQIYSYKSKRGITGGSTSLSKAKKSGILRYR